MTGQRHRSDIDGLRCVAVLAVIANHFSHSLLPSGHLGVDVFFVISGYVVTLSLMGRGKAPLSEFLLGFYGRRVKRLGPALIACVAISSVLLCLFSMDPGASLKTGLSALVGLANIYLYHAGTDYFATSAQMNLFTHMWSLGVEEQFYLLFPALWYVFSGNIRTLRVVLAILTLFSLAAYLVVPAGPATFYLSPFRFWQLGIGCLLATVPTIRSRWLPSLALIAISMCFVLPQSMMSAPAVAAATGVLLVTPTRNIALTNAFSQAIGKWSYSLYLWHWTVLSIARRTVGVSWTTAVPIAGIMLFAAWLSYTRLELPLRRRSWSWPTRVRVGALFAATAMILLALAGPFQTSLFLGRRPSLTQAGAASLKSNLQVPGLGEWHGLSCTFEEPGRTPDLTRCSFGHGPRVLVVGNSYAAAFTHGFVHVAEHGRTVSILAAWGASPVGNIPNNSQWQATNADFWSRIVPHEIETLQRGEAVFLLSDLTDTDPELLEQGLRAMGANLGRRGIRLYVLDQLPFIRDANCRPEQGVPQWFAPFGIACKLYTRTETLDRRAPISTMLARLDAAGLVHRVDLIAIFCPGQVCGYAANGMDLYRDEFSHPSVESMRQVGPLLVKAIEPMPLADVAG